MEIRRDFYLDKLIKRKNNGLIKVITGIRLCGKSYLLNNLFYHHLLESGVDADHIIRFAFDSADDLYLIGEGLIQIEKEKRGVDPEKFMTYIRSKVVGEEMYYLLLDEIIYHCIGFTAARRTQHDGSPKWIHDIDPAVVPTLFVVKPCRKIDRILTFNKPCFLHETLVFVIEHIVHEVVLQQTAHPQTAHQQADITCANGQDIQSRHRLYR